MRILAALLAAVPLNGLAEPLFLEFEGAVESADPAPWWSYAPGDPIKGLLRIYPDRAPPDFNPAEWGGDSATGGGDTNFLESRFVGGIRGRDAVHVGRFPDLATYAVHDQADSGESGFQRLEIFVSGAPDLVRDDGIVQSFDAIPAKDGSTTTGTLERTFRGIARAVRFALTRVSLTPGSCRP